MKKISLSLAFALFMVGCSITTKATLPDQVELENLKNLKTVKVDFDDQVQTDYSKSGIDIFNTLLLQRLGKSLSFDKGAFSEKWSKGMGYEVVDEDEDFSILIKITYFKPDNKVLRNLVGFGSGKGGLAYEASFIINDNVVGVLNGGKSYGDVTSMVWEPDQTVWRGSEGTQIYMVRRSVDQIIDFLNGKYQKTE